MRVMNNQKLMEAAQVTGETVAVQNIEHINGFAVQAQWTVNTPSAVEFPSYAKASKVIQDLTYTADTSGAAGNSITIAYVAGGTAGAEVVTVTGTAISVSMATGVSTATQIKTAVEAKAEAAALVDISVSGNGATAQVAAVAAALADGVGSSVSVASDFITKSGHGLFTGLKGQLTTTGTLPDGLAVVTDYFVIVVDSSSFKFASSLANALAGTAVDIEDDGALGSVHTFTPTTLAGGVIKLQASNDGSHWSDLANPQNVTGNGTYMWNVADAYYPQIRVNATLTAGAYTVDAHVNAKGLQ